MRYSMHRAVFGLAQNDSVKAIERWFSENRSTWPGRLVFASYMGGVGAYEADPVQERLVALIKGPEGRGLLSLPEEAEAHIVSIDGKQCEIEVSVSSVVEEAPSVDRYSPFLIESLTEAGALREEIEHDIDVMLEAKFPESVIRRVLDAHRVLGVKPESISLRGAYVPVPGQPNCLLEAAEDILAGVSCGRGFAVMLSGGQSTGKSLLVDTLADIFGQTVIHEVGNEARRATDFFGNKVTDNSVSEQLPETEMGRKILLLTQMGIKKGGICSILEISEEEMFREWEKYQVVLLKAQSPRVVVEKTPLVKAVENGGWYVLDEANCCDPNALEGVLNALLDGTGYIIVPGVGKVNIHPNFRFFATQNPGMEGTLEQNQATLSRMSIIDVPYADSLVVPLTQGCKSVGCKLPDEKTLNLLDGFYKEIVTGARNRTLGDACLSVRGFVRAVQVAAEGGGIQRALLRHVVSHASEKDKPTLTDSVRKRFV